jgi:hypothetical protein
MIIQWDPLYTHRTLKGHISTYSVGNFYSLQCIINVFLIIRQNAHVIWPVKREIQSSDSLSCKQLWSRLYRHVYSMRVRNYMYVLIYKFILNINKLCLVFATSGFVLKMIFSSMPSIFELCQRKQGSCLVSIRDISVCYISRLTQDLEFIFRLAIIEMP